MESIIYFAIIIIALIVEIVFFVKRLNNTSNMFEKTVYEVCLFLIFIPYIIYCLDRYNIPTLLGYTKNINIDNWFMFFSSYFGAIFGALISGIILIGVTYKQYENDYRRKKEDLIEQQKVNNIPILKYEFYPYIRKPHSHILIMDKIENNSKDCCIVNFNVENIGLNTAKNIKCSLKLTDGSFSCKSIDDGLVLKVDSEESFGLFTSFDFKKSIYKDIIVTFHYDDLFNNHYKQDVRIKVKFSKSKDSKAFTYEPHSWDEIKVEKQIEE